MLHPGFRTPEEGSNRSTGVAMISNGFANSAGPEVLLGGLFWDPHPVMHSSTKLTLVYTPEVFAAQLGERFLELEKDNHARNLTSTAMSVQHADWPTSRF